MPQKIVIASGNQGKIKEFNALFEASPIQVVSQADFNVPEAEETGLSFVENAIIKARNACIHTNLPAIADDSGLAVDALNGQPGIYSARYSQDQCGEQANDESNNKKLLEELKDTADDARSARFICALAFMQHANDPTPVIAVGEWKGKIIHAARGENGFGYDPLFYVPEQNCTSAELSAELKNSISHRGQAIKKLFAKFRGRGILGD